MKSGYAESDMSLSEQFFQILLDDLHFGPPNAADQSFFDTVSLYFGHRKHRHPFALHLHDALVE